MTKSDRLCDYVRHNQEPLITCIMYLKKNIKSREGIIKHEVNFLSKQI